MLKNFSKIIYIFLSTIVLLLITIIFIKEKVKIDNNIIFLIILILFPFFDLFLEKMKKDLKFGNLNLNYGTNFIKYLIIFILGIFLYFKGFNFFNIFIYIFIIFNLLFKIDAKISFIIALILLVFTSIYLGLGDKKTVEILSINAYYFLILGILVELKLNILTKNNLEENKNNFYYNYIKKYRNIIKSKYIETKNNILKEIGEEKLILDNNFKKVDEVKNIKTENINISKNNKYQNNLLNKNNIYIKLIKYFFKKIKENIVNIVYLLFIINSILIIFLFKYNIIFLVKICFGFFIILYIYSKFLNKKYLIYNFDFKEIISKKYFLNKAIFFASFGLISSYFLLTYLKVNIKDSLIFISIFLLFLSVFYILFYNINKREFIKNKAKNLTKYKLSNFISKHIYLILNLSLIFIIIFALYNKNLFINNNEKIEKKDNLIISKNKINNKKNIQKKLTYEEKEKLRIKAEKELNLISGEAKINNLEDILEKDKKEKVEKKQKNEEISVKKYFKFTRNLSLGSKNIEVKKLEEIMQKLGYFNEEPDNYFNINTKKSLIKLLKKECSWPETTKGILGIKAQQCLYSLKIKK